MAAMGETYGEMLRDRDELLLQMHFYSACDDAEIAEATRAEFGRLWREVARLSGASDEELQQFFAMGMLMNVIACMDATSTRRGLDCRVRATGLACAHALGGQCGRRTGDGDSGRCGADPYLIFLILKVVSDQSLLEHSIPRGTRR